MGTNCLTIELHTPNHTQKVKAKIPLAVVGVLQKEPLVLPWSVDAATALGSSDLCSQKDTQKETYVVRETHYSNNSRPHIRTAVTLEDDEQSYLLGEKNHLLFTVQERKLTRRAGEVGE